MSQAGGGLGGVLDQVKQGLLQLARVGAQTQALGLDRETDLAATGAPVGRHQLLQTRKQLGQLQHLGLGRGQLADAAVMAHEGREGGGAAGDGVQGQVEIGAGLGVA